MNAKFLILSQRILGDKTKRFFFLGMSLPCECFFFKKKGVVKNKMLIFSLDAAATVEKNLAV